MKRIALLAIALVATAAVAQEAAQEPMFVSLTYVAVKPDMTQAFMAAMADHTEWHKSINDTHYYGVSQVMSGPRTGQILIAAGPMTGAEMDAAAGFSEQDMGDIAQRGMFSYVDGVETIVVQTMPGLGNPPPAGVQTAMTHVYELTLDHAKINDFTQALNEMNELQNKVGAEDDYNAWAMPVSGTGFNERWFVTWVDGWADTNGEDPERQGKVVEAAGGQEAFDALVGRLMGAVVESNVTTYMYMPQLSHRPGGQ